MPTLVFRSSFAVLWRWTSTLCGIIGAIVYIQALVSGAPLPFGLTFGLALGFGLVFAVAVVCFPVYVRADGLRCYNFYGLYRTLRWEDIADIRKDGVLGLPYLVVSNSSGWRQVWVPLYLSDMPGFARAVRACTGDGHMLVEALEEYEA
jgi:hypothetical protein